MALKNKILGYLSAGLGLAGLAAANANIFQNINKFVILIPSMILIAIGVMIMIVSGGKGSSKSHQAEREVPIYKGKEIIGYRIAE